MKRASTKGRSSSPRRASVLCGSSRAQRRAASKSNSATSESELQLRIDLSSRLLERLGEVVFERDRRQRELDQVRIGLDAGLPLGLPDQGRTHPAAYTAALPAQETRL